MIRPCGAVVAVVVALDDAVEVAVEVTEVVV